MKEQKTGNTLKPKQQKILKFIREHLDEKGYPPSIREIGDEVKLRSTASVYSNLKKLEKLGYIRRNPTLSRSIELVGTETDLEDRKCFDIPVIKSLSSETALLSSENIERYFPVMSDFVHDSPAFLFPVHDDTLAEEGVFTGDYLLLEEPSQVKDGDTVLAVMNDTNKIKRFFQDKNGEVRLEPKKDAVILSKDVRNNPVSIAGKVIGLFHKIS